MRKRYEEKDDRKHTGGSAACDVARRRKMNKLIIIGNLTRDPELAETASGISYAKFAVAVTRNYSNSDGERETDFFDITVWRERAELCARYLRKGNKVAIVGSVQFRTYEDDNGSKHNIYLEVLET